MNNIYVYVAQRMTHRFKDEMLKEALILCQALRNYGFYPLSPVIEEGVENKHELLEQTSDDTLRRFWKRDKEMLQDCHIMLDYQSCNKSDGVGVELAYTRFGMWKPVVRVFPNIGYCISKIEYDTVTGTLPDALIVMSHRWGTKRKLLIWRLKMLWKCLPKFVYLQLKFIKDLVV